MIRTYLEPKSNRETFVDDIELFRDGEKLDLTGITAKIQLERADAPCLRYDYTSWYPGFGYDCFASSHLLATTENGGASIVSGTKLRFVFTVAQMQTLPAGQYRLSAVVTSADGSVTTQLFQYQIPILDGGVPTS